jgi:hypothetical protein
MTLALDTRTRDERRLAQLARGEEGHLPDAQDWHPGLIATVSSR